MLIQTVYLVCMRCVIKRSVGKSLCERGVCRRGKLVTVYVRGVYVGEVSYCVRGVYVGEVSYCVRGVYVGEVSERESYVCTREEYTHTHQL